MAIATILGRGVIEAAVGAAPAVEIIHVFPRQLMRRNSKQRAREDNAHFRREKRVAVAFVLPEICKRLVPPQNGILKRRGILAQPDQRLHLLPLEDSAFLFQLFQGAGMMRANERSDSGFVRWCLSKEPVTANHVECRGEVRTILTVPAVGALI